MINASERYGSAIELRKALLSVTEPLKPEPIVLDPVDEENLSYELPSEKYELPSEKIEPKNDIKDIPEASEQKTEEPLNEIIDEVGNITDDLPVSADGYDPSVDIYKKKSGKGKGKLIASICAAAAVVVAGVSGVIISIANRNNDIHETEAIISDTAAAETSAKGRIYFEVLNLYVSSADVKNYSVNEDDLSGITAVQLDSEYPGAWNKGRDIPKSDLMALSGDVEVTLNITVGNYDTEGTEYFYCIKIIDPYNNWDPVTVSKARKDDARIIYAIEHKYDYDKACELGQ